MALTVQIKGSIEIVETGEALHQGTTTTSIDTPVEIVTQTNASGMWRVPFTASAQVTLWDDSNYGLDELTFIAFKSDQDGTLGWQTVDEAATDDASSIDIRANVVYVFAATDDTDKLQAMKDHSDNDVLGGGTLADITKFEFLDKSGDTGSVQVIAAK